MSDVFISVTIQDSTTPVWKLSALFLDGKYTMVGLETPFEDMSYWDNPIYLYGTLYPLLRRFIDHTLTEEDVYELHDNKLATVFKEDNNLPQVLFDMLDKGKELGWHLVKL
jgi:hypothetical protein